MKHHEIGDGDVCPQDKTHGRMWVTGTKRQFCPHSGHRGCLLYEYDGITPVSQPAPDNAHGGLGAHLERTTPPERPASMEGLLA